MKISYNWLKTFLDLSETPEQLAQVLTQAGLEVESIEKVYLYQGKKLNNALEGLVIGQVLTCEKHPNADKLFKTTVSVGSEILPIVCGASNVAQGQKVLVATVGTILYPTTGEPFIIKKAKIRGEESLGMICAEDEIGIGESHEGIMVLNTTLPDGTPAAEFFSIETDYIFEIGLTPNRIDAASHLGVARDLKVLLQKELCRPSNAQFVEGMGKPIQVIVEHTQDCPRYAGILIENVSVKPSPHWLKNRLKAIGLNPINNVVDITNYVLHHLGQPLHAFDADRIAGNKIIVKKLPENTPFVTLDGIERKLSAQDLIICDTEKPLALAGIFGGLYSGITEKTTRIFLESAYFHPDTIRKTAQRHSLKTDASFRFERGTDPNMPVYALKFASVLISEIAGGKIASEIIDIYPQPIAPFHFEVRYKNLDRLIGKSLDKTLVKSILNGLEIEISNETEQGFSVSVPPYRVDVRREADIVEEILRIYGFNNLEFNQNLSASFLASFPKIDKHKLQQKVTEILNANSFNEIITNSLTKPEYAQVLKNVDKTQNVVILNKLSEELEVLRQSLIFSGLEVIAYNLNRKQKDIKIFEFGKIYRKKISKGSVSEKYEEQTQLALWAVGNWNAESWQHSPAPKTTFHHFYNILDKILQSLKVSGFTKQNADERVFAYGLALQKNDKIFAQIGELQPYIPKTTDLKGSVFYAELDWDWLVANYNDEHTYQEIPKFPEVRRDLSLVLDKTVTYQEVEQKAFALEKKLLKAVNIFSIYEGEQLGEGKKSYAISFILQDETQTLTDLQIDKTMQKLMEGFKKELGAIIRD